MHCGVCNISTVFANENIPKTKSLLTDNVAGIQHTDFTHWEHTLPVRKKKSPPGVRAFRWIISSMSEDISCGPGKDVTLFQQGQIIVLHQEK